MNRLAPVPSYAVQRNSEFFIPLTNQNFEDDMTIFLLPNETSWVGPYPTTEMGNVLLDIAVTSGRHRAISEARRLGVYVHVQAIGRVVRCRRLSGGPIKKLSDWKLLPINVPMLIDPAATDEDYDRSIRRAKYMVDKGMGTFLTWVDDDSFLWVKRTET